MSTNVCHRRSPFRHSISAGGATTLTSIAAACYPTLRTPSLVSRTCKQSRAIPVLSEETRNTGISEKWLLLFFQLYL